ncbi:hypothetical protein Q3G72_013257 [Acer saccharum]|nr:hypothetical protein Q3G72_013257 [Acer saccharum]
MESINSVDESVGENVEEVKEGDLVLPVFSANCGECRDCKSTKSNNCSNFIEHKYRQVMPRDGTSRFRDKNGELLHHFLGVSSFTEYTVVDVSCVVKINREIPVDKACLLSCGVSTDNHIHVQLFIYLFFTGICQLGYVDKDHIQVVFYNSGGVGAASKVAEVEPGSTVAIFGLGAVGLAVAEGARLCKASKIIGVDLNPEKFELGKIFGLTDFINPANSGDKTVSEVIKEMTDGGADYCFECIGLSSVMKDAFDSSRQAWLRMKQNAWYKGDTHVQPSGEVEVLSGGGNPQ